MPFSIFCVLLTIGIVSFGICRYKNWVTKENFNQKLLENKKFMDMYKEYEDFVSKYPEFEKQKELHRDYGNYANVERDLIVRNVSEALSNTATYMVAEDSYASGRAVFSDLAMQQLKEGIFKTSTKTVEVVDTDGTKFKKKEIRVVYDENGNPVIQKPSLLKHYGIEIL